MKSWEAVAEKLGGGTGMGVGIAAALLAPALTPLIGRGARWAVKEAIKGYLVVTSGTRRAVGHAGETLQDLVAEAKAEADVNGAAPAGG